MTQPRRRSAAILTALTTVATTLGLLLAGAPPATAAISTGHGVGHLSENGVSWIGSYRLDDGSLVFCLEVGKKAPTGHDYQFVDGAALGRFATDDLARLAYISRTAAPSADPTEAAAGQLATWRIAGLDGRSPEYYAQRAGASGQAVLDRSSQLLAAADAPSGASRGVMASVALTPADDDGRMTVTSGLTVDFLSTGPTALAPNSHSGTMSLSGAVFDDGKAERTISNGETLSITTTGTDPTSTVVASVRYNDLPYGSAFTAGHAGDDVQQVLVARPGSASGSATVTSTVPSTKSFQPIVATKTSAATAGAGEAISDELTVSALVDETRGDLLPGWGLYRPSTPPAAGAVPAVDENGMLPIPVVVESSLLGPFSDPIAPAAEPPTGAPVVCTVEVRIETGPGTYRTPECILPGSGYFVWVERISPSRTPVEQGGTRILPWQSAFGTASEVTFVAPPPAPEVPPAPVAPAVAPVLADTGAAGTGTLALASGAALTLGTLLGIGVLLRRRLTTRLMQPATD
ncbi:hypothetical protein [Agreia bicolorata]|uniref:hypothetical protein n=1 Tax=Agreia bicolorata TaxID=110935 RepID=UPI000AF8A298|nr:hypothetical protein [Agreia bicolorata]